MEKFADAMGANGFQWRESNHQEESKSDTASHFQTVPNSTKAMKITAVTAIAALALPSAVVGGRCYTRKQNRACKNPEDIFKIIRDIDKDEW